MKISIIGTGYVGLVTGSCFAQVGNEVLCVDINEAKIDALKAGQVPIFEPGLARLVKENVAANRLQFTTDIKSAISHSEVIFIAVGTPAGEDGSADLAHVLNVANSIGQSLDHDCLVVTKSTVPVGTALKVRGCIQRQLDLRDIDIKLSVAANPEFLKEGAAVEDFMKPDRIIVGVDDDQSVKLFRALYAPFNRSHNRLIVMDIASAELTKYAANAMLATKISFMNELANIAERLDADIESVRQGIGSDPRIGYQFIYPGCGYGGSCFPKDIKALQRMAVENDYQARILTAVEQVNDVQKSVLLKKVDAYFENNCSGRHFAVWGLAFKPNTDDLREAPSRTLIDGLLRRGASITAFDPVATNEAADLYAEQKGVNFADDPYSALQQADALIIVTEWRIFCAPDFAKMKSLLNTPLIFDGRNIYQIDQMNNFGFTYFGIGRSN